MARVSAPLAGFTAEKEHFPTELFRRKTRFFNTLGDAQWHADNLIANKQIHKRWDVHLTK